MILPTRAVAALALAAAVRLQVALAEGGCPNPDSPPPMCHDTGTKKECIDKNGCATDDDDCCCVQYTVPYCGVPSDCNENLKCLEPSADGTSIMSTQPTADQIKMAFTLLKVAHDNAEFVCEPESKEAGKEKDKEKDEMGMDTNGDITATNGEGDKEKDKKDAGKEKEKMGMDTNGDATATNRNGNGRSLKKNEDIEGDKEENMEKEDGKNNDKENGKEKDERECPDTDKTPLCWLTGTKQDCVDNGGCAADDPDCCCVYYTIPYCGTPSRCNNELQCSVEGSSVITMSTEPSKEERKAAFGFLEEVLKTTKEVEECVAEREINVMSTGNYLCVSATATGLAAAVGAALIMA